MHLDAATMVKFLNNLHINDAILNIDNNKIIAQRQHNSDKHNNDKNNNETRFKQQ